MPLKTRIIKVLAIFVFVAAIFAAGAAADFYYFSKIRSGVATKPAAELNISELEKGKPQDLEFGLFWDVWKLIQEDYVGRRDLDAQKMIYGAVEGLVKSLGDPYSSFLQPKEKQEFEESISGSFEGIGIEIGMRQNVLTVIAPLEGTPAKAAGLRAGDEILKINEESTADMSMTEAVSKIRGPKNTEIKLTILREGWDEPREFEIMRNIINVPSVTWKEPEPGIAQLKIHNFHSRAIIEFETATKEILKSGMERIVLDLRDNPGGFLDYSIDIAGWFLRRGSVVVKIDDGTGPIVCRTCRALGNQALLGHKIVVLVNEGSASAAEILAGALRDNLGITLIGARTFGKGSVQELEGTRDEGALKLTVAKWFTPNGTDISTTGIEPEVVIKNPTDGEEQDLQLEKAIEILRSK